MGDADRCSSAAFHSPTRSITHFPGGRSRSSVDELSARGGDDQHVGVLEELLGLVHHQPPDMRDVIQNVFAIGSHQGLPA